jgi:hypothetical protein
MQEIIQALIKDRLIENAKMQAHDRNFDNISMLVAIATGRVVSHTMLIDIADELLLRPELY